MTTKIRKRRANYFNNGGFSWQKGAGLGKNMANAFNSGALSGAIGAASSMVGQGISGGLSSGVGNAMQGLSGIASAIPGPWGAVTSAGLNIVGGLVNRAFGSQINEQAVAGIRGAAEQLSNRQFDASNTADLLTNANYDVLGKVNKSDIGKDGWFSNKVSNLAKELTALNMYANNNAAANYAGSVEKVDTMNDFNALKNQTAFGGPLMMRYTGPMSPFGKRFDTGGKIYIKPENRGKFTALKERTGKSATWFKEHGTPAQKKMATFALNSRHWSHDNGGPLYTQGGTWDTGMTYINEGGTHEENPYEGIQVGVDPNGIPNTVEEGEVIFNDYVFSNRLKLNKGQKEYFKLGKNKEYSYADAAKKLTKEFEETPNDPISKNGRNAILQDLMMFQEEKRAKQQERRLARQFDKMSTEEKMGLMEMANQYAQQQSQEMQQPQEELQGIPYAKGGRLVNKFVTGGPEGQSEVPVKATQPDQKVPYSYHGGPTPPTNPQIAKGWDGFTTSTGIPLRTDKGYNPLYTDVRFQNFIRENWNELSKWWTKDNAPDYFAIGNTEAPSKDQLLTASIPYKEINKGKIQLPGAPLMYDDKYGEAHKFGQYALNKYLESLSKVPAPTPTTEMGYNMKFNPTPLALPTKEVILPNPLPPLPDDPEEKEYPTWMREMPVWASGVGVFTDALGITNKPDYSSAKAIERAVNSKSNYLPVSAAPVGQKMAYKPVDINKAISQLNANTAATRRSIIEGSLGNRTQALRGIQAVNKQHLDSFADTLTKTDVYNQGMYKDALTYNKDTDKFDSENALKAAMANQGALTNARDYSLKGLLAATELRQKEKAAAEANRSANLTNFLQGLHDIGSENMAYNQLNWANRSGVFGNTGILDFLKGFRTRQ